MNHPAVTCGRGCGRSCDLGETANNGWDYRVSQGGWVCPDDHCMDPKEAL